MKAVGYQKSLPIDDKDALLDFETAKPEPKARPAVWIEEPVFGDEGRRRSPARRRAGKRSPRRQAIPPRLASRIRP